MRQQHELFECHPAWLAVNPNHPHLLIGASLDGLISCTCCGVGLLEIKCPYKHKETHPHQVDDPKFCLCTVDGTTSLNRSHDYYMQVQGQMAICNKECCDFVCWTPKGMHMERISFEPSVFHKIKPSLDRYFLSSILPELLTHAVKDGDANKKNAVVHANTPGIYLPRYLLSL